MRKNEFKSNIKVVAKKNYRGKKRVLDYYLLDHHGKRTLIYTGDYGAKAYNICKGGIQVNGLLSQKTRNTNFMKLVEHMEEILPDYLGFDALALAA